LLRALATGLVPTHCLDGLLAWRGRAEVSAFVRGKMRERRFEGCAEVLECAGHDPAPFEAVTTEELRRQLHACIDGIPNRDQRESVRLRLVDGLSPSEIARQRAAEVPAVRVWVSRGAALVRACLQKKYPRARGA
jgi:DNA-directed RNA polymerase specialized sigma24 family protein